MVLDWHGSFVVEGSRSLKSIGPTERPDAEVASPTPSTPSKRPGLHWVVEPSYFFCSVNSFDPFSEAREMAGLVHH